MSENSDYIENIVCSLEKMWDNDTNNTDKVGIGIENAGGLYTKVLIKKSLWEQLDHNGRVDYLNSVRYIIILKNERARFTDAELESFKLKE